jgi:prevent-host-death family protein
MPAKVVNAQSESVVRKNDRGAKRSQVTKAVVSAECKTVVVNIREARENFSHIVSSVAAGSSRSVVIGNRGVPAVAVVSYDLAEALRSGDKKRRMAALIVEELLGDAPLHLKTPAVDELSRLPKSDLDRLWGIETLSLSDRKLGALRTKLAHPEVLDRLVQRFNVTTAISKARAAGLYDSAEDATSALLGDGEAAG